jgi:CubicO group peptidase (beta-lactamase class C family)
MQKSTFVLLIGCFVIFTLPAHSEEPVFIYPDTPAGRIAESFLEALNSGDEDRIREFTLMHRSKSSLAKRPLKDRIAMTVQLHNQVGVLAPVLITEESDRILAITVHSQSLNMWLSVRFELDEDEPEKLSTMSMRPASPPDMKISRDYEWEKLSELLVQVREDTGVPALAAAMVVDGRIVDEAVIGLRRSGSEDSVSVNDRFHIGSITKSMTASMIGRLIELEILTWDATVEQVLPDAGIRNEYRPVTIEQLLQHRSGLQAYLNVDEEEIDRFLAAAKSSAARRLKFCEKVLQEKSINTPGSAMSYSNAGYVVAGAMAEQANGKSWESMIREYIFEPCGMAHSGFGWPATKNSPGHPRGHYRENGHFRPQRFGEYIIGDYIAPAGDIHTSIGDLARYAIFHLRGFSGVDGFLSPNTIKRLHAPLVKAEAVSEDSAEDLYAAGWVISHSDETGVRHWHEGSAGTFFASIELYPHHNRAIVIAMNVGTEGELISSTIRRIINERWNTKPDAVKE